jgi:Ni,Fe-hydrogenase maturation factor
VFGNQLWGDGGFGHFSFEIVDSGFWNHIRIMLILGCLCHIVPH